MPKVPVISANDFEDWLKHSNAGQHIVYHKGFLSVDRLNMIRDLTYEPNVEVDELAKVVIAAFDAEKIYLYQRKVADMEYEYIAMKRSRYARNW